MTSTPSNLISPNLVRLFPAEISNERRGGVSPATLSSTIDSLAQGGIEVFDFLTPSDLIDLLLVRDLNPGNLPVADLLSVARGEEQDQSNL